MGSSLGFGLPGSSNNIIGEVNTSGGSSSQRFLKSKSMISQSREEVTPERSNQDLKHLISSSIGEKRANNKYLLPSTMLKQDSIGNKQL